MGNYKSIITVGVMGGVLVFMAGILLDMETAKKRRSSDKVDDTPSVATVVEGQLVFLDDRAATSVGKSRSARGKPSAASRDRRSKVGGQGAAARAGVDFVAELASLRDILARARELGPEALRAAEARRVDLARFADAKVWPHLEAELARKDHPRGYLRVLLLLAARTKTPASLAKIVAHYESAPMSVVESLQARGDAEAFAGLCTLVERANTRAEKFTLAKSMRSFSQAEAASFVMTWLNQESDLGVACELATQVRGLDREGLAAEVSAALRKQMGTDGRARVAGRLARSLAGLEGGPTALLSLLDDEVPTEVPILGAVFASCRAADLVPTVAKSLMVAESSRDDRLRFLERNVSVEHRDLLVTSREICLDEELRARLQELIERLEPADALVETPTDG